MRSHRLALLAFVLSLGAVPARAQSTFLSMTSEPGDYIGQGQTYMLTPAAGTFTAVRNIHNGVTVQFSGPGPLNFWILDFTAAQDAQLVPGLYEGATRFPQQTPPTPALWVAGEGRVCDTLTGRFVVLEAVYGPGGEVVRFAADFEQHCTGAPPALYGSIRFDSSVTVAPRVSVNGVTLTEGDGGAVAATFLVSLSGPAPVDVTVDYQAADGTATAGLDYVPTAGTVTFPAGETVVTAIVPVLGDELDESTETFRVLLDDPTNATIAFGEATGTIVDDDPEKTFLYVDSDPGDSIGGGVVSRLQVTDGTFSTHRLAPEGVRVDFDGPGFWSLIFLAPNLAPLTPGVYENAQTAYSDLTVPGLEVTGNHHACGGSRGRFVVLEVVYGPTGEVERFAADFEQRCANFEAALVGSVRYRSQATVTGATMRPFQVGEGAVATATVTLSWPVSHPVTVAFETADGTATAPADYTATSGVVTFAPGETAIDVAVPVSPDSTEEADERFDLRLTGATGGTVLRVRPWITILDDDPRYPFELVHGTVQRRSLGYPNADGDTYAIAQDPYSSWEAVVDETSGDIGWGNGPLIVLRSSSGTAIQYSTPVGAGPSQSLRVLNNAETTVTESRILVTSAACSGPECTADDTYRIRFYDTTYRIARYNTTGGQRAVLLVQNPTAQLVRGWVRRWSPSGTLAGEVQLFLEAHASTAIDLNALTGPSGAAGSITIATDAPYGALSGKLVGLDPETGFSFDSPMLPRPR